MNTSIACTHEPECSINAIKAQQKATWEDGDYASFARYMQDGAVEVLHGWNIQTASHLLDVGCGAG